MLSLLAESSPSSNSHSRVRESSNQYSRHLLSLAAGRVVLEAVAAADNIESTVPSGEQYVSTTVLKACATLFQICFCSNAD